MSTATNKANNLQQNGGQIESNQPTTTLTNGATVMTSMTPPMTGQPTQLIWTGSSVNEVASQLQTGQATQMTISSQAQQPPPPAPTPTPQPIAPAPQQTINTNTTMSTLQQTLQQQMTHQTGQTTLTHTGVSPNSIAQQQVRDQWTWKPDEQGNPPMCVQVIQQPMTPGAAYLQPLYNTQGQLIMPGNLASQPGGMNSQIQVISAGKLGLPNLLSTGPHMLTATSGGKQIIQGGHPNSPAGSYTIPSTCANQTLVIGQLGMISSQPNVLPNTSGATYTVSKPNDLQKAFGNSLPQGLTWAPQALQTSQAFLTAAPSSIFIRPSQQDGMYIQSAPPPTMQQGQTTSVNGSPAVLPSPPMTPKPRSTVESMNMTNNVNVGAVTQNIQPKPRGAPAIMSSLTLTQIRPASSVSTQTAMVPAQTGQVQGSKSQVGLIGPTHLTTAIKSKARGRPGVTRSSPNPKVQAAVNKDDPNNKAVTSVAPVPSPNKVVATKSAPSMVPVSSPMPTVTVSVSTSSSQTNSNIHQTKSTQPPELLKPPGPQNDLAPISVENNISTAVSESDNGVRPAAVPAPGVPTPAEPAKTVVTTSTNLGKPTMTVVSSTAPLPSPVPLPSIPTPLQNGSLNGVNGEVNGDLHSDTHDSGTKDKPPQRAIVKPQLLTHVIDGFVIQEGIDPFPLTRNGSVLDKHPTTKASHVLADKENHVIQDGEPPKKKPSLEVIAEPKTDVSKCELCGKVKSKMRIKASKKFCSNTCAKRYSNLVPTKPPTQTSKDNESVYNFDNNDDGRDIDLATLNKKWKNVAENIAQSERDKMDVDEPSTISSILNRDEKEEHAIQSPNCAMNGPKMAVAEEESLKINPIKWTVNEVCDFIRNIPGCTEYADDFALQEIDGQALMLLKEDHLMTAMSMKLGPALKICAKIDTMRGESKSP